MNKSRSIHPQLTTLCSNRNNAQHKALTITILVMTILSLVPMLAIDQGQNVFQAQQATTEGPYLINEPDRKILRVPYLHQDRVGHCWLYSIGMVVTYYGLRFDPDEALARVGLGFDIGANIFQIRSLLRDLYRINTEFREVRPFQEIPYLGVVVRGMRLRDFINLVASEIDNQRPIILIVSGRDRFGSDPGIHVVVITGYVRAGDSFNIIINDPSGWLTHGVLGVYNRFDGFYHNVVSVPGEEYGVLVVQHVSIELDFLYNHPNITSIGVILVRTNLTPRPPRVTVQAFPYRPRIYMLTYNASRMSYHAVNTSFYHNNFLNRSLWYNIPIARINSKLVIYLFAFPNTMNRNNFMTKIHVEYKSISGIALNLNYELSVDIYNNFLAIINCPTISDLRCFSNGYVANITLPLGMPGDVHIRIETTDSQGSLEHEWGTLRAYVYEEVVIAEEYQREGNSLHVVAGVNRISNTRKVVDIYFQYRTIEQRSWFITTAHYVFLIKKPTNCSAELRGEAPSRERGGYYWTCRVEVDADQKSLSIEGDLVRVGLLGRQIIQSFMRNISLNPVESSHARIKKVEVGLSRNIARVELSYCTYDSRLREPLILTVRSDSSPPVSEAIELGTCGNKSLELDWSNYDRRRPLVNTTAEIASSGELVYYDFKQILNPRIARVVRVEEPNGPVRPGSWVSIKYSIELYSIPIENITSAAISSVVVVNGTPVSSRTSLVLSSYDLTSHRFVYDVTSYFRVPNLTNQSGSGIVTYDVVIYPVFIYDEVEVFSPDLYITSKIESRDPGKISENMVYVLVIDVSGSMVAPFKGRTKLDWAKEAATLLVDMTPDGNYIGLVVFSTRPEIRYNIVQINSTIREDIKRTIRALVEGGSTNIGDSLKLATDMILNSGLSSYLRQAIILLTDGMHNTGTHPTHVLDYVKKSGIRVFTIGLGEPQDIDEDILKLIADTTSGKYYYAPSPDKLKEIFLAIRGAGLVVNQIDSVKAVIKSNEQISFTYDLDPYANNHTFELSWDQGNEPEISLTIDSSLVVTKANATNVGILFEYPTTNVIRIIIPEGWSPLYAHVGRGLDNILTVTINITNRNPQEILVRLDVIGGVEELLYVILDEPSGRYQRGQPIHYKVISERNTLVVVTIEDDTGTIHHIDSVFIADTPLTLNDEIGRQINVALSPGTYYLKARLYKQGIPRRIETIPITIIDSEYSPPIRITANVSTVSGPGVIEIPISIQVDNRVVGKDIQIYPRLTASIHSSRQPRVYIDPWIIKMSKTDEKATLKVEIPIGTTPGTYNVTLITHTAGLVVTHENVVTITVANTTVELSGLRDVVVTRVGESLNMSASLKIIGDRFVTLNISLRASFPYDLVQVNGKNEISLIAHPNQTFSMSLNVVANNVGMYAGKFEIYINNTFYYVTPMTVIIVSPEADTNNIIWSKSFGSLRLGPTPHIRASISVDNSSVVSGFIAPVINSRSTMDYIVYISRDPASPKPVLSLFFENDTVTPIEIVVDDMAGGTSRYTVAPSGGVVMIELGERELYRVRVVERQQQPAPSSIMIHIVTETVTTTHTVTETIGERPETTQLYGGVIMFLLVLLACSAILNILLYKKIQR